MISSSNLCHSMTQTVIIPQMKNNAEYKNQFYRNYNSRNDIPLKTFLDGTYKAHYILLMKSMKESQIFDSVSGQLHIKNYQKFIENLAEFSMSQLTMHNNIGIPVTGTPVKFYKNYNTQVFGDGSINFLEVPIFNEIEFNLADINFETGDSLVSDPYSDTSSKQDISSEYFDEVIGQVSPDAIDAELVRLKSNLGIETVPVSSTSKVISEPDTMKKTKEQVIKTTSKGKKEKRKNPDKGAKNGLKRKKKK